MIRAVIANESLDPSVLSDADFLVNYPFLTVLPENAHWAGVGATAILNLCTGKVMLVALTDMESQFSMESRMLYPDWQPPPGAGISFDWSYRLGDSANGMMCISVSAYSLEYVNSPDETEDLPWYYVPITEVRVNGTKVENTSPQVPLTIPPLPYKIAINITMMVNPGDTFVVTFVSSKGEIFIRDFGERELHIPIHSACALSMAEHFGCRIGDTNWDDSIDMNGDLQIDIFDAILLARFAILQPVILDVDCSIPSGQGYGDTYYPATFNVSTKYAEQCILSYTVTVHYYEPDNEIMTEFFNHVENWSQFWSQFGAHVVHPEVNWVMENTTHGILWVDPDYDGTNWTNITMTRDGNNFYGIFGEALPFAGETDFGLAYGISVMVHCFITAYNGEETAISRPIMFTDWSGE